MKPIYLVFSLALIATLMLGTACFAADNVFNVELRPVDQSVTKRGAIRIEMVAHNAGDNSIDLKVPIGYGQMRNAIRGHWELCNAVTLQGYGGSEHWDDPVLIDALQPHSTEVLHVMNMRNIIPNIPHTLPPGVYLLKFRGYWQGVDESLYLSTIFTVQ